MKTARRAAPVLAPLALVAAAAVAMPATAQTADSRPKRTRVTAGAQLVPQYPGADGTSIQPLIGLARADAGEDFDFSSADQAFGLSLVENDSGFAFGPSFAFQGTRSRADTNNLLPKVGFSVEAGGFAQYQFSSFRLRGEVRQGVTGHKGLVGTVAADFVARDGDNWLFAIGPRLNLSDGKYQRAYFGVPAGSAIPAAGLPAYRPDGGIHSYGATASANYALNPRLGLAGYTRYERLVNDAGRSPVVRNLGDRNQWSGGVALTYTFGG